MYQYTCIHRAFVGCLKTISLGMKTILFPWAFGALAIATLEPFSPTSEAFGLENP